MALIYNRPYQKDPIFPERPFSTFDYAKNCQFADTVRRLQKSVKDMKPVINSYVAYDKVATVPAKRREPVRPYFNDQYEEYLNPRLQNLRPVTSFGYEQIYRRPKTHEERLLDAIRTKKAQKSDIEKIDFQAAVERTQVDDPIIFQTKRRYFNKYLHDLYPGEKHPD